MLCYETPSTLPAPPPPPPPHTHPNHTHTPHTGARGAPSAACSSGLNGSASSAQPCVLLACCELHAMDETSNGRTRCATQHPQMPQPLGPARHSFVLPAAACIKFNIEWQDPLRHTTPADAPTAWPSPPPLSRPSCWAPGRAGRLARPPAPLRPRGPAAPRAA